MYFNSGIISDHTKWAEFGTYISGVYSPFISLLAFFILIGQFKSQQSMDKHQRDQNYIGLSLNDFSFYLDRMELYIDKMNDKDPNFENNLGLISQGISIESFREEDFKTKSIVFVTLHRKLHDLWVCTIPIYRGLGAVNEVPYQSAYRSVQLKAIAVLSLRVCQTLEAINYCLKSDFNKDDIIFNK
jgi:hypothetical protein